MPPRNGKAALDATDARLLAALDRDARLAVSELARLVGMSAPAVAERMRRLEATGVLKGFCAEIDPRALGYAISAMVRIRPLPGKLHLVEQLIDACPNIVECHKITGDDPFLARMVVRDVEEMDSVLEALADHATTSTAVIKSQAVRRRLPPLE
ncbi:Lrp/AsnC family transcriptional regulator [Ancylobacter oerskovii]|uniref:Lrp/AsnC family transcriptional regulator n=1 Tax=Ancylobacter oerskovii TaxID=459519 RepID=A0ABW4Z476_9HYPH|nr:Lrp/AsnC family transcriptional regulator [Ancylobacter oerskovii]MBS7545906.1 Lrp/AsnC family transcriptional regulator [Ancylobacter oerskovii]